MINLAPGALIVSIYSGINNNNSTNAPEPPPETPEQAAARQQKDAAVQQATAGAKMLKKAMRDPDSFKLDSALVVNGSGAACYEYRAKNGFGGTNRSQAVLSGDGKKFKASEMDGFNRLWNKECAGKAGTEVGAAIRWLAL